MSNVHVPESVHALIHQLQREGNLLRNRQQERTVLTRRHRANLTRLAYYEMDITEYTAQPEMVLAIKRETMAIEAHYSNIREIADELARYHE